MIIIFSRRPKLKSDTEAEGWSAWPVWKELVLFMVWQPGTVSDCNVFMHHCCKYGQLYTCICCDCITYDLQPASGRLCEHSQTSSKCSNTSHNLTSQLNTDQSNSKKSTSTSVLQRFIPRSPCQWVKSVQDLLLTSLLLGQSPFPLVAFSINGLFSLFASFRM